MIPVTNRTFISLIPFGSIRFDRKIDKINTCFCRCCSLPSVDVFNCGTEKAAGLHLGPGGAFLLAFDSTFSPYLGLIEAVKPDRFYFFFLFLLELINSVSIVCVGVACQSRESRHLCLVWCGWEFSPPVNPSRASFSFLERKTGFVGFPFFFQWAEKKQKRPKRIFLFSLSFEWRCEPSISALFFVCWPDFCSVSALSIPK